MPLHSGSHTNSALFSSFCGLFRANVTEYKQCKLLVAVHVCFSTRTRDNWHSHRISGVVCHRNLSHYWLVVQCVFWCIQLVIRFMLLPDCQSLNYMCKLLETIFICGLSSLCRIQLVFRFVQSFTQNKSWGWNVLLSIEDNVNGKINNASYFYCITLYILMHF